MAVKEKKIDVKSFVSNWQEAFTSRIKKECKSRKQDFRYYDAVKKSKSYATALDKVLMQYVRFISANPLKDNDFYKYVNSYIKGKKLNDKFFRHDLSKLYDYYTKVEDAKANESFYNPFSKNNFESYVLFMMLKLSGNYKPEFNEMFNVTHKDSREYNPLTKIPSVLRQCLPFKIKEYDIARAYPTFIFMELGIEPFDVYSIIDKRKFNTLLNIHKDVKDANIEAVRSQLEPIYKERVDEVVTNERFNTKGGLFMDLAKYEAQYIKNFIEANKPENYVRLHDGIVTNLDAECAELEFGIVKFKVKEFIKPEYVKNNINFYEINDVGKVETSPVSYARFLKQENFIRITREGFDQLTILKNENRIVSPINHKTDLVPFFKANINEYDTTAIEDRIARDASNVIQQSLQLLTPVPLQYHRDTKKTCDIPFKNGIARITANNMELISYDNITGFFAKHTTQEHEISFLDFEGDVNSLGDFASFLAMAATNKDANWTSEDENTVRAFYSMFGYLITNYKNPAFNPAIILSDEDANGETRNGGRGKSLLQMALTYFRPAIQKGGNAYDPSYTHVHADLKKEHDLYLLDDVPSGFRYDDLYTNITGAIDAQRKGTAAETIAFEDAPKFVISTNWAVRYDAENASTERRFKEYKFSKFWNIKNKPDEYFGKSFFSEWNESEWNAFFNFGFYCVQIYLEHGLTTIQYDKKADNYRAYFYNDAILNETERIFDVLKSESKTYFGVADFVEIHKRNDLYRYKPEFTIHNARKYITAFIEANNEPYIYNTNKRKWQFSA